MSPRRRPDPVRIAPAPPPPDPLTARRAAAFARAWPLLATSVPTADIVESYLRDVVTET